jgi:cytochrome b561
MTPPSDIYTTTAKTLHWCMAVLLMGMLGLGFYMADLPLSPDKLQLYAWHKWVGVSVFLLVWLRLVWRITHRPPPYPASMSRAQQWLAHGGHWALYGLMVIIPLTGWLMSSAKGFQTVWWGLWPIPDLLAKDKALGHSLQELHEALNGLLLVLIGGHAAAALKHHWIDRDGILNRMLPQGKKHD